MVQHDQAAIELVMQMMAIPGKSCEEGKISEFVKAKLLEAGVPQSAITNDDANERTRIRGEVGNLIVHLPGTVPGPTLLLSAHLDTVPICVGCQPVLDGDYVSSTSPKTGLGADNRAGVAAIVSGVTSILRSGEPHGPIVLCFFVQEEIGLQGSRNMAPEGLGAVDLAVNFDGGTVEKLTIGATGGERMLITIRGLASHAGIAPEAGVNASTIFAIAAEKLHHEGWLGRVDQPEGQGTSNIGMVHGGDATNVVMPELVVRAEARSHDSTMRQRIVQAFRDAFEFAVSKVESSTGRGGSVTFESNVDYESFRLEEGNPSVALASKAIESTGRTPFNDIAGGGLDANWLHRHGIPAVTLGCGQRDVHTVDEKLFVPDFLDAVRIVEFLIRSTASL